MPKLKKVEPQVKPDNEATNDITPVDENDIILREKDEALARQAAQLEQMREDIKVLMQVVDPRQLSRVRPNKAIEGTEVKITLFRKDISSPEQPLVKWRSLENDVMSDTDTHRIQEKQTVEVTTLDEKSYKMPLLTFGKLPKGIAQVKKQSIDPTTGITTYTVDYKGEVFDLELPFIN